VVGINRATVRYRPTRKPDLVEVEAAVEAAVESRLAELAEEGPRFGYRRLGVLLRREGYLANHKRVYRLYKKGNLALSRKTGEIESGWPRPAGYLSLSRPSPTRHGQQAPPMDFMHDTLTNGHKFRTMNIVGVFTRECRAIEVSRWTPVWAGSGLCGC
jgi:putative transposase